MINNLLIGKKKCGLIYIFKCFDININFYLNLVIKLNINFKLIL